MKRYLQLAAAAALALSLASCDALDKLLSVNLFYTPLEVSASDIQGMSLSELERLSKSPEFYPAVFSDPAAKSAFKDKVATGLASGNPATVQQSAILGADMLIYGSGADQVINNVINSMTDILDNPPLDDDDFQALIEAIVPTSLLGDEAAFKSMINAMVDAADYYDKLGESIGTGDYAYGGANAGEIAMNALLATMVYSVTVPGIYTDAGDYFYYLLTDLAPDTPTVSFSTEGNHLANLLAAAGLDSISITIVS
jgi:hypothetical protein